MSCNEIQQFIDGYIDGELDLVKSLEMEQHLQTCSSCTQSYKNRQALHTLFSADNLYYRAPQGLHQRVQLSIQKAGKAPPSPNRIFWRTLAAVAVLTTMLLVTWGVLHGVAVTPDNNALTLQVVTNHISSLTTGHTVDVLTSNEHQVKPWFDGKIDFSPPVVDLAVQGYTLIGGRRDYLDNRTVAVLVYRHGEHIINLYIWPSSPNDSQQTTTATQQGYHLTYWAKAGMEYWAVSDLEESQLQTFVHLIQQNTP